MSRHHKSEKCLQDVQEKETNVHESIAFILVQIRPIAEVKINIREIYRLNQLYIRPEQHSTRSVPNETIELSEKSCLGILYSKMMAMISAKKAIAFAHGTYLLMNT